MKLLHLDGGISCSEKYRFEKTKSYKNAPSFPLPTRETLVKNGALEIKIRFLKHRLQKKPQILNKNRTLILSQKKPQF